MPFAFQRQHALEQEIILQLEADLLLGHNDPVVECTPSAEHLVWFVSNLLTNSVGEGLFRSLIRLLNKPNLPANPSRASDKPSKYSGPLSHSD